MKLRDDVTYEKIKALQDKGLSHQMIAVRLGVSKFTIKKRLSEAVGKKGGCINRIVHQNIPTNFAIHPDDRVTDFAAKLQKLVSEAPDSLCRKELLRTVNFIRTRHNVSSQRRKEQILQSIQTGGQTLEDIADDCGLDAEEAQVYRAELLKLIEELIVEKKIIKVERGGIYNRGRKTKYQYAIIL